MKNFLILSCFCLLLIGCSDNDKKIIGEWQRTVVEYDGGKYTESYTFYDEEDDNRVEYNYIPKDFSHIGFRAYGRWDLDLIGNLKLFLDPKSAKPVYNFYADEWQQVNINNYIMRIRIGLSEQLKEMEENSIILEITDDSLILETLSGKDTFHRIR